MINDKEEISSDHWNPKPETFARFLKRDLVLAKFNMMQVLQHSKEPMMFREIKECLLHSSDTLEKVLSDKVASGQVVENKGSYRLIRP
jgi:hypothetical protein